MGKTLLKIKKFYHQDKATSILVVSPKTIQASFTVLYSPPELDGTRLSLKTLQAFIPGHGKIEVSPH